MKPSASHCLLCANEVGTSVNSRVNIFAKFAKTSAKKSITSVLDSALQTTLNKENSPSSVVCKKCMKLVNQASELETTLQAVREAISKLYKESSVKLSKLNVRSEELNDHDYIDGTEHAETVSVAKTVGKPKEIEKKPKKVTIVEPEPAASKEVASKEVTSKEVASKEAAPIAIIPKVEEADIENDEINDDQSDDDDDGMDTNMHETEKEDSADEDSQFEEVIVPDKTTSLQKPKAKKEVTVEEMCLRNGKDYVCVLCPKDNEVIRDAKEIITHLKEEHDCRLYVCDICGERFKKRNDLSSHLDEHVAREEGDFQCEICNRIFSNLRLFRIHKRIHYPQVKSWSCETCGKRYSSKNLLDEHMNTHTGNRPYICESCGKDFASKYTYRAHAKTHEARPRPFECTHCNKTFLSQQNLTQHMKTHNGVKEHVCEQCGKAFGSAHNLEVHNIVHTGYKPYICRVCGKAFARKAEIRDHERTHTGEKPYQCEFCGAQFSQRSNLQSHKRATHYNDKRYKCDDCGKGFKRRRLLDYHIKAAHTGERPYKCETCSATFVYPEHYKKHTRIHTGEKPYLCEVCGKAFNSRDNRNAHRFIHSDKKPYECLVCGMGFMRKPLLYTHMQMQGHMNDTIVVNQPRLTTEDDIVVEENNVHIVVDTNASELGQNAVIVTELKDHVIIQDEDENILGVEDDNEDDEEDEGVETTELRLENGELIECKQEVEDTTEDVFGYQDEEGNTIVLPPGADIKEIIGDGQKTIRLVQIRLPADSEEARNWLSAVQNS